MCKIKFIVVDVMIFKFLIKGNTSCLFEWVNHWKLLSILYGFVARTVVFLRQSGHAAARRTRTMQCYCLLQALPLRSWQNLPGLCAIQWLWPSWATPSYLSPPSCTVPYLQNTLCHTTCSQDPRWILSKKIKPSSDMTCDMTCRPGPLGTDPQWPWSAMTL